jgi:hypothetical protein
MCGKIRAAADTRRSRETLIIARTDAVAVEGFEAAIERATMYREAGADILFVEAPRSNGDLSRMVSALGSSVPLMANMVEGGKTPTLPAAELEKIGFALVIFPGAIVRAFGFMASEFYTSLATHGSNEPYRNRMLDFTGINELVGTPEMIALGQQYETPAGRQTRRRAFAGDHARPCYALQCSTAASSRSPTRWTRPCTARRSIRSLPKRTTPATASITPKPAPRWCKEHPACRSSSAPWLLRSRP